MMGLLWTIFFCFWLRERDYYEHLYCVVQPNVMYDELCLFDQLHVCLHIYTLYFQWILVMLNAWGLFVCIVFFFLNSKIMQKPSLVKLPNLVLRVLGFSSCYLVAGWVSWIPNLDLLIMDSHNVSQSLNISFIFITRIWL